MGREDWTRDIIDTGGLRGARLIAEGTGVVWGMVDALDVVVSTTIVALSPRGLRLPHPAIRIIYTCTGNFDSKD